MSPNRGIINFVMVGIMVSSLLLPTRISFSRERKSSGTYKNRSGVTGAFQKKVNRTKGTATSSTTWQNERGQGSHQSQKEWDQETGRGRYSSSTTTATGKASSRQGTVTKNDDGSYSQKGTITGPKGKTTTVDRDWIKNEDGSRSVHTTYTGENGQTLTSDKTVTHADGKRDVTGSYSSSTGKNGTYSAGSRVQDGKVVTGRSLTNQDNKTWQQHVEVGKDGGTITRDVTNTRPDGQSKSFSESVTFDRNPPAGDIAP